MAVDKRTILSSKRARSRRKKAQRARAAAEANAMAVAAATAMAIEVSPECDHHNHHHLMLPTATPAAANEVRLATSATTLGDSHGDEEDDDDEEDVGDEEEDEEDEEDELVFVCRPTVQDFCTDFVAFADELSLTRTKPSIDNKPDYKPFTVRIPAFRETREGFITYTIAINTCHEPKKHFQLERRFSEFVALATAVEKYLHDAKDPMAGFYWELPPKTWFKVTQVPALEERRSKLETCLESLLAQDGGKMCRVPLIRDFLMLDIFGAHVVEEKQHGL